jgi:hypothetical protein
MECVSLRIAPFWRGATTARDGRQRGGRFSAAPERIPGRRQMARRTQLLQTV